MRSLEECEVYYKEISRVTKANSFVAFGRVIYIVKQDWNGKAIKNYACYDKETRVLLGSHWDKEYLISFIQKQDLSILGNSESSLF